MPAAISRVVYLGLDGGTQAVLDAAFERGWMPHLRALWRRSATGQLASTAPMITPVAWTSFLTGAPPEDHGIHEFYYLDAEDGTVRPNHAGRVRVPGLWQVLDAWDRPVISLNLPMTYPAPEVSGLIVAGSDAPGRDWAFAQCPDFYDEIRTNLPDYTHKIVWKRRPRTLSELRTIAAQCRAVFDARAEAAERADARTDWSALMVHFHNLDSLLHRLWPYLDLEDGTAERAPAWHDEIVACLRSLDEAIGRLLELASRRDAAVIAVSDHGFGPCHALVNVNGILEQAGLFRGRTYGTRFAYRLQRLRDRYRRWQARRRPGGSGRRFPRSVAGQVGCDWSRTLAFAPFGQLNGSIYLNPEQHHNASRADRTIDDVIEIFNEARDPETGRPLFAEVFSTAERYGLEPAARGMPEVLALSADGFQAQAKWGIDRRITRPDWNLPATHYRSGILAIHAPGVRAGDRLHARLEDVAPTSLALLDLPIPGTMQGRVLDEAFEQPLPAQRIVEAPTIAEPIAPPAWIDDPVIARTSV